MSNTTVEKRSLYADYATLFFGPVGLIIALFPPSSYIDISIQQEIYNSTKAVLILSAFTLIAFILMFISTFKLSVNESVQRFCVLGEARMRWLTGIMGLLLLTFLISAISNNLGIPLQSDSPYGIVISVAIFLWIILSFLFAFN